MPTDNLEFPVYLTDMFLHYGTHIEPMQTLGEHTNYTQKGPRPGITVLTTTLLCRPFLQVEVENKVYTILFLAKN